MKLTFNSLLGVIPRGASSVGQIVAVGVSVKKEARTNISTIATNPGNATFKTDLTAAVVNGNTTIAELASVYLEPTNLLNSCKGTSGDDLQVSNRYYSQYALNYSVNNLALTQDRILNTFEEPHRKKILEGLVGAYMMEIGGPFLLKLMLDIIIDVDDRGLRALTQSLLTLCLKDVHVENVCIAVNCLKGALLLLQDYSGLPINTMGLLNDNMGSADCNKLSGFMNSVYFDHKKKTRITLYQEYLRLAEAERCTLYRA